jgi:SAM-dependent methyltransferase
MLSNNKKLDNAFLAPTKDGLLWKVEKIIPLLHRFVKCHNKTEINLLDIGGGSGLILKKISSHLEQRYTMKAKKFALDKSPRLLEIQKRTNYDLKRMLNEDICYTSLKDKEIDLALMIDVLEHIPTPELALEELKRVSNFVILKVPLEENFHRRILNLLTRNKYRQQDKERVGHIITYNFSKLRHQIENHLGQILDYNFTNSFDLTRKRCINKSKRPGFITSLATYIFKISPIMSSILFYDFIMILVKTYPSEEKFTKIRD